MSKIYLITGTDTGVGKTVLTTLLAQFLRGQSVNACALKPICSGGRDDALKLFEVQSLKSKAKSLSLDEINPWHFRAPIAPALAARHENKRIKLAAVVAHVRAMQKRFDFLIVEGAGGLLSPLGENFNSRNLISKLRATPIIVVPNQLGVINQILLTLEALPQTVRRKTKIVLMSPAKPDAATSSNVKLLSDFFDSKRIFQLPWFDKKFQTTFALKNARVRRTLRDLAK